MKRESKSGTPATRTQPTTARPGTSSRKKPQASNPVKQLRWWTLGIVIAAFAVFSPALQNELVNWDDYNYIRDNPVIRDLSAGNLFHIFGFSTYIMGNYHPFTLLSYMADYAVAGTNPFIYHLHNIILHLINIVLVVWFTWLLTRKMNATLIAALLFAIHPMRVESVVWASERKDVLYTLWFLLSAIAYLYYRRNDLKKTGYYAASLLFFLFSLLSKGQAVVLPLVLILADFLIDGRFEMRRLLNKIPFLLLSLASGIQAILAQSSSLTAERMVHFPFYERMIYAACNITAYLWKLFFPYLSSCYYGYPSPDAMLPVYAGAVLAVLLLIAFFLFGRKNKSLLFGGLFFLSTIIIVIQLLPVGNAIIADRYTYLPYLGLFIAAGLLIDPLLSNRRLQGTVITVLVLQTGVFAVASFAQSKVWRNNETLWKQAIRRNPTDGLPYNNLGYHYVEQKQYMEAFPVLEKAIQYKTDVSEVYHAYQNLGKAYLETGRPADALEYFTQAVKIEPSFDEATFARGLAFSELKLYDSAVAQFTRVLQNPKASIRHPDALYSRAMARNRMGLADSALADYTRALGLDPDYTEAYTNRGNIYFNRENFDRAIADYSASLSRLPGDGKTFLNRSFAYFKTGKYPEALRDAEMARSLGNGVDDRYLADLRKMCAGK